MGWRLPVGLPAFRSRRVFAEFALIALLGGIGAFLLSRILPADYVSKSMLLISGSSSMGQLAEFARVSDIFSPSAFGPPGEQDNGYTYIGILKSDATLRAVLANRRLAPNQLTTYFELFAPKRGTDARRWEVAVDDLRDRIRAGFSTKDYFLSLSVRFRDPQVAQEVAELLVAQLREFNSTVRASRAGESAKFIAARLAEAADSLRRAEDRYVWFRETNARIGHSPALEQAQARLLRTLQLSEQTYTLLAKQLEIARVEEKREVPVFTVVDPPRLPAKPQRISGKVAFLLGALLSSLVMVSVSLWRESSRASA